jgi:hypothetical protein
MKHDGPVVTVVFSPDGTKVATASVGFGSFYVGETLTLPAHLVSDKTARLWDAATGRPLGQPMKHDDAVRVVVFSPDSTKVATASDDKTARLWDAATGKPLGPPMKHDDAVLSLAFSLDGTKVATVSRDGAFRLWPVPRSLRDDPHEVPAYVDAISGWKADSDGALHRITVARMEDAWREVLKSPGWLDEQRQDSARRAHVWHEIEARDNEAAQRWFAAAFHLRWLCKADPKNVELQNRLRHAEAEWAKTREQMKQHDHQVPASGVPQPREKPREVLDEKAPK